MFGGFFQKAVSVAAFFLGGNLTRGFASSEAGTAKTRTLDRSRRIPYPYRPKTSEFEEFLGLQAKRPGFSGYDTACDCNIVVS